MFYKPGSTMHAVGICQTIGRITGCAMPELPRRLYAPKDVYDTYIRYNQNQELFITKIGKGDEDTITKDIIEELVFNKYTRNIDMLDSDPFVLLKNKILSQMQTNWDNGSFDTQLLADLGEQTYSFANAAKSRKSKQSSQQNPSSKNVTESEKRVEKLKKLLEK